MGSRYTDEVGIDSHECQCLLDTASLETAVPVSFNNPNIYEPIHMLNDLLQTEGGAGQFVTYP